MRIRYRRPKDLLGDFPMTVDQELAEFLAGRLHLELYHRRLAAYLLPPLGADADRARKGIELARAHEARGVAG
jgi:hypothetical protein